MKHLRWLRLALLGAVVLTAGCSAGTSEWPERPVAIAAGDIGTGCGMAIDGSPGPRAEAYVEGHGTPLKFGDTRDFFAYVVQPEHRLRLRRLYVQDAGVIDWRHPSDAATSFIDARTAWYVAWQPLLGMMGPTFASFAQRAGAEAFVAKHGGKVLRFDEITPELVGVLEAKCPADDSPAAKLARGCVTVPDAGARLVERTAVGR